MCAGQGGGTVDLTASFFTSIFGTSRDSPPVANDEAVDHEGGDVRDQLLRCADVEWTRQQQTPLLRRAHAFEPVKAELAT